MGQKIHPLGFRVNITQDHQSQWFAEPYYYPLAVMEDCFLRQLLFRDYFYKRITTIKIKRKIPINQILIEITTPEASHTINDCKQLKKILKSKIKIFRAHHLYLNRSSNNFKRIENQLVLEEKRPLRNRPLPEKRPLDLLIEYKVLRYKHLSASFFAQMLVLQFEKRIRYRKALTGVLRSYRRAQFNRNFNIRGIKIQVSGRINGAEIARTEWTQRGRVPLHTLRADIDYSCRAAKTIYGLLGVKVWLFRDEIIDHKSGLEYTQPKARETNKEVSSEPEAKPRVKKFGKKVLILKDGVPYKGGSTGKQSPPTRNRVWLEYVRTERKKLKQKEEFKKKLSLQKKKNKNKEITPQQKLLPRPLLPEQILEKEILKERLLIKKIAEEANQEVFFNQKKNKKESKIKKIEGEKKKAL